MNPIVIAALITSFASIIGAIVLLWNGRRQLIVKLKELDLQQERLKNLSQDIKREMTVLQQEQLRDVLKKRLETYPQLWETTQTYWQHWCYDEKELDKDWADTFLREFLRCSEQGGVYFSQPVYHKYHEFRCELLRIRETLSNGEEIDDCQMDTLNKIWFGDPNGEPGLSTALKNDLGSYQAPAIQSI